MSQQRRGMEYHSRGRPARLSALCAAFLALGTAAPALAVLDLKRGDPAPSVNLVDGGGTAISLESLRGRPVVLLFAEAGHQRSGQAAKWVSEALKHEALAGQQVGWVMVYTKSSDPGAIEQESGFYQPVPVVVHDVERDAFGAYQVVVLPSAVVIGPDGNVVHAVAGLGSRFGQTISDALLLAAGQMTVKEFELALNGPEARDEDQRRADRLTRMARRLGERGEYERAEDHFLEALELAPDLVEARLGAADLLIRKKRLDDAEAHLRRVLDTHPRSLEASTALALVHALRGGEELQIAEVLVTEVLERSPNRPRAYYVLGLIHEQRGEALKAAGAYRRASELLLDRADNDEASVGKLP